MERVRLKLSQLGMAFIGATIIAFALIVFLLILLFAWGGLLGSVGVTDPVVILGTLAAVLMVLLIYFFYYAFVKL